VNVDELEIPNFRKHFESIKDVGFTVFSKILENYQFCVEGEGWMRYEREKYETHFEPFSPPPSPFSPPPVLVPDFKCFPFAAKA